ncbi:MAG: alpha/beta fold hydrolase [Nanoarchaeota archaeon]|nr:alpha/beta fold hydrolase [Nanoarchaeota archaeon]
MSKRIEIKNRHNKRIVVLLDKVENQKGLVFVMHGLSGEKTHSPIPTFTHAFIESNFTAIRFDVTHTYGESEGSFENANLTNYYEDLEDVIKWAETQEWYQEPFCLVGHSLGGISTALFAEKFPQKIKALAPISTVVSGKLHIGNKSKEELEEYNRTGWRIRPSSARPGLIKRLRWPQFQEDMLKYDLLKNVNKLTMPILMIVGEKDTSTIPQHQQILFDALSEPKELHIIKNAPHTFRDPEHLKEIKEIFLKWISKI